MFWQWMLRQRQPIQPFFHDIINRFMYFLQQGHLQCFLFRVRSNNYVCSIIILTQEEEHNQHFRSLSVEFSTRFVHFIHPYMNPLPSFRRNIVAPLRNTWNSEFHHLIRESNCWKRVEDRNWSLAQYIYIKNCEG